MKVFLKYLNPTIIKSIMLEMTRDELVECVEFIKTQAMSLEIGAERDLYVSLFNWSSSLLEKKFEEKPSLF